MLFALNSEGVVTLADGKGLDAVGLRPGDIVGRPLAELPLAMTELNECVRRALAGEQLAAVFEAGGRAFEMHVTPVFDDEAGVCGVICVATDITSRKRAADALKALNEALEQRVEERTRELAEANHELQGEVTERRRAEEQLRESEKTTRALLDAPLDTALLIDTEGVILALNKTAVQRLGELALQRTGKRLRRLVGRRVFELFPQDMAERRRARNDDVVRTGKPARFEDDRDGRWLDNTIYPIFDADGRVMRLAVFSRDITERKRAEKERARLTAIVEATTDLVSIADATGEPLYLNRAGRTMLGIRADDDISGVRLTDRRPPWAQSLILNEGLPAAARDGAWASESAFLSRDGQEITVSEVILAHRSSGGAVEFFSTVARDISDLLHVANHDALTGLPNRRCFGERLERGLSDAERCTEPGALLFLDVDRFKDVNDSRGHAAGDELIAALGRFLRDRLRETDVVARLGGDEFAVLLPRTDAHEALAVATQLLERIHDQTFVVGGEPLRITASAGVALFPDHGSTAGELLGRADRAMYQAKDNGRNRTSSYVPGSHWEERLTSRLAWEARIRDALERDLFVLHAQPIFDIRRNVVTQYELLLRMDGGPDGLVPAADFVGVAERSGLIHEIDRWVLRQAVRLLAERGEAGESLHVAVNLSGQTLGDPSLVPMIRELLEEMQVDPAGLVLEITETAAVADVDHAQEVVRSLRALGCGVALDDFGVGFSSISQLKHLPVNYLKIDGSFIRNVCRDRVDQQLVRAIVTLARALGKQTIAEYVEDGETLALLRKAGVDFAQGYHVGAPGLLPALASRLDVAA